jgi:hypothetical protein
MDGGIMVPNAPPAQQTPIANFGHIQDATFAAGEQAK